MSDPSPTSAENPNPTTETASETITESPPSPTAPPPQPPAYPENPDPTTAPVSEEMTESPTAPAPQPPASPPSDSQSPKILNHKDVRHCLTLATIGFIASSIQWVVSMRYLKTWLGYGDGAQIFVPTIGVIGLIWGVLTASRSLPRLSRPLLPYAMAQAVLALIAVYFHDLFVAITDWADDFVTPRLESDFAFDSLRWSVVALLILPPSFLAGMSLPFAGVGVARLLPEKAEKNIALIWLAVFLGSALGVALMAFLFLPFFGSPFTLRLSGITGAVVALLVWIFTHIRETSSETLSATLPQESTSEAAPTTRLIRSTVLILGAVFVAHWVAMERLFGVAQGSSPYMGGSLLSSLAVGGALGAAVGLLLFRRLSPVLYPVSLAWRIMALGFFCLFSSFAYFYGFNLWWEYLLAVPKEDEAFRQMVWVAALWTATTTLPFGFCAGLVLPLLTRYLFLKQGENALITVSALAMTGAVVGLFLSIRVLTPAVGFNVCLLFAGLLCIGLATFWLAPVSKAHSRRGISAALLGLIAAFFFGNFDSRLLFVGPYQQQQLNRPDSHQPEIAYLQQGQLANVSTTRWQIERGEELLANINVLKINGNRKAVVRSKETDRHVPGVTREEVRLILPGLLPLLYRPEAERVLNIGFNGGLTARTLLLSEKLRQLENVVREPHLVEAVRALGELPAPVFDDPRNHFVTDSARAVLTRNRGEYDIIVSRSNGAWEAADAALLSREFYLRVRNALGPQGVFVQSFPLLDSNARSVAAVAQALEEIFGDYQTFVAGDSDLLFIATRGDDLGDLSNAIFAGDRARLFLQPYQLQSVADIAILSRGDRDLLSPYFRSLNLPTSGNHVPTSSDYYPRLQYQSIKDTFHQWSFFFPRVALLPVPVYDFLGYETAEIENIAQTDYSKTRQRAHLAERFYRRRAEEDGYVQFTLKRLRQAECPLAEGATDESAANFLESLSSLHSRLLPFLSREKMEVIWEILSENPCINDLLASEDTFVGPYTQFWRALALRDSGTLIPTTDFLLRSVPDLRTPTGQTLLLAAMAANYQAGNHERVLIMMFDLPLVSPDLRHAAQLIAAHSAEQT